MITPSAQLGSSLQLRAYRPDLASRPTQGNGATAAAAQVSTEETDTAAATQPQDGRKGQRLDIYG